MTTATYRKMAILITVGAIMPLFLCLRVWYPSVRQVLAVSDQVKAQRIVTYTMGLLFHIHGDVASGRLTLDDGQEEARRLLLGPKRANGTRDLAESIVGANEREYVYAVTPRALTVMHPFLEGVDMWEYKSPDGRYLIRELVNEKRLGKVLEYTWQNPGQEKGIAFDYAEYFEPWGWVVAYGGTSNDSYMKHLRSIYVATAVLYMVSLITLVPAAVYLAKKMLEWESLRTRRI